MSTVQRSVTMISHRIVMLLWLVLLSSGCGGTAETDNPRLDAASVYNEAASKATASSTGSSTGAQRIVSLDYCADQFVLKFAPRDNILAVSPDAAKEFSYMRDAADGLSMVQPRAEDVILLEPDLVVRSYGGGANSSAYFEQLGIPVLNVGWAGDIEGVLANVERMASSLGDEQHGRETVANVRQRLKALSVSNGAGVREALYMTPSGATTGSGSLVHELLDAAGLSNFQTKPGWRTLPLERLAYEQPAVVAAAFFNMRSRHPSAWSASRHPVAQSLLSESDVVYLQGAWMTCGGWYLVEAVEALAGKTGKAGQQ